MKNTKYAELHAHSAFSFQEGTDMPHTLVAKGQELGLSALGILDIDGMYSAIQTAAAARTHHLPCVYGAELTLTLTSELPEEYPLRLPVLIRNQRGYHSLCSAISHHNLQFTEKDKVTPWSLEELANVVTSDWVVLTGTEHGPIRRALARGGLDSARAMRDHLLDICGPASMCIESTLYPDSSKELAGYLHSLAQERQLPLVATGATRCATPSREFLAQMMTASRTNHDLYQARPHFPHPGSFLRSPQEMVAIHSSYPQAVGTAAELAEDLSFDLLLMEPQLPHSGVPDGYSDDSWLRHLVYQGARERYGSRNDNAEAWAKIDRELAVIEKLSFAGYFLIVKDIVDFCRSRNILAQGRGSAASSCVCFALGITAVDAHKHSLLFERFLSESRRTPPDIDVDIEAKRREEVIQYVYKKYGRTRAAQVANVVSYRPRSALRMAGRALGFDEKVITAWSKRLGRGGEGNKDIPQQVRQMAQVVQKLPRHMSIHPGGMVLTRSPVSEICPVMWAAKDNRSVLQWDKEDCAEAGLVKFDLLGLGMLTALRKSFDALNQAGVRGKDGKELGLYNLPDDDPRVYDLLCAAETVGVFQVESRAQMGTLPRMQPREFYDLVVEVALIRPGPIQGQAVNPYLERRNDPSKIECHPLLRPALGRTLGVPIFQEQLMQISVDVAGFSAEQADQLRRAIASKYAEERLLELRPRLLAGMTERGLPVELQEQLYDSLHGFAEFGFPESHAFSFAFLVYASAWLKTYYPEHFFASLIASQPLGFYSVASLIADAERHGVTVLAPCVVASDSEAVVEGSGSSETEFPRDQLMRVHTDLAVRLGLSNIKGLSQDAQKRIIRCRDQQAFAGFADFARRTALSRKELELLARSGACEALGVTRREALWLAETVANPHEYQPYLPGTEIGGALPELPPLSIEEKLQADWATVRVSVGTHPMELVRNDMESRGILSIAETAEAHTDTVVRCAGVVTHRQRPGTARGVTFVSLEDETGLLNVVCTPGLWKRYRRAALTSQALIVTGKMQRRHGAYSLQAHKIETLVLPVNPSSRDFR